ncbi:Serine protease inhibitor dipetalogastin [Biomphalaria glabrata]|nr:Serine protease inhibitor dipetalogastin [Biomphalaria glabrata]
MQLYNFERPDSPAVTIKYDGQCRESKCDFRCVAFYNPVCGSDNNTYLNPCILRMHNCRLPDSLAVAMIYKGKCRQRKCRQRKCRQRKCNFNCSASNEPVCGSDNSTYLNTCSLELVHCQRSNRPVISVKCNFRCPEKVCTLNWRCMIQSAVQTTELIPTPAI